MADVYAGCRTYRDKGVIEMVAVDRGADLTEQWGFDTSFRRPGRVRFEYRDAPTDGKPCRPLQVCRRAEDKGGMRCRKE